MRIKKVQKWVREDWEKRSKPVDEKTEILFLLEELGEFAEMIRMQEGHKDRKKFPSKADLRQRRMRLWSTPRAEKIDLEKELGDLLVCLATLANRYGIDLEKAFLKTKKKIEERHRRER